MTETLEQTSTNTFNAIPSHFQTGMFALKWPEDTKKSSTNPLAVTLSIDQQGYYLICLDRVTKEIECFDIALIHDTRTDVQVSLPSGASTCNILNIGVSDASLPSKWLTIYYGNTFIPSELRLLHFVFESPNLAREWAEELFRMGHSSRLRNLSSLDCLMKLHSKIINTLTEPEKNTISTRRLSQFLCKNVRDSDKTKLILAALQKLEYLKEKDGFIDYKDFTFNAFFDFYINLMEYQHQSIKDLFVAISDKTRQYTPKENFREFLRKQTDPFNDAYKSELYETRAKDLIRKYFEDDKEPNDEDKFNKSFLRYLLSFDNLIIDPKKLELFMDMDKPLSHYFIASSHNTYLTGSQFSGRSSIEMYRQVLLSGCRCIELDVVESENKSGEPEIKHKNTPVKSVRFLDAIIAIKEYAFTVTPYPLILSIENHCRSLGQKKMAKHLVDIFGDHLVTEPLSSHPCEENYPLPSPKDLLYKVLIKNKKIHAKTKPEATKFSKSQSPQTLGYTISDQTTDSSELATGDGMMYSDLSQVQIDKDKPDWLQNMSVLGLRSRSGSTREGNRTVVFISGSDYSDDENGNHDAKSIASAGSKSLSDESVRETNPTEAMSQLVVYTVPTAFRSFAYAKERHRSYEMSSHSEERASNLIRDQAKEFVAYNQRQLTRIYPRGRRVDSTNYHPFIYWSVGCQMCALNYQTLDVPMQINLAFFSFNGGCGYIEKPSTLCQVQSSFDPQSPASIENVVGYQIFVKVISGQFLCQDREPSHVDVQMYGLYGDSSKRRETMQVNLKKWNGFYAIYDDSDVDSDKHCPKCFKVTLPDMAALRFSVSSDDGTFIGQSFIPIAHLRPGYRCVPLRNQINVPVQASSLLVFIRIKILVNPAQQQFADRLVDPLMGRASDFVNSPLIKRDDSSELNLYDDNLSRPFRYHGSFSSEPNVQLDMRNRSASIAVSQWYEKHLIAASKFHDTKTLCKLLSLNDIVSNELVKTDKNLSNKIDRISRELEKKIQERENLFKSSVAKYPKFHFDSNVPNVRIHSDNQNRTSSDDLRKNLEEIKNSLLEIYSHMFHRQEEVEIECLNDYYHKIKKFIEDDYEKKLRNIDEHRVKELLRAGEQAQCQIKRDALDMDKSETDRTKINSMKEQSLQSHKRAEETVKKTIMEMCEQVKNILIQNLRTNLIEVANRKELAIKKVHEKYSNQVNLIKGQLDQEMDTCEARTNCGN